MTDLASISPSEPQLSADSIASTPESVGVTTPKDTHEEQSDQTTPQPKKAVQQEQDGEPVVKSRMLPPPLPIKVTKATPMARLPSLQQISSRLNPGASPTLSPAADSALASSAPKLSLATNVPPSASSTSPFASSPSGRLKMPISAMKRTQSQQGTPGSSAFGMTTPLAESSTASSFFTTGEPMDSPAPVTAADTSAPPMTAGQSVPAPPPLTRGMSTDAYIKGYKDVPSLVQIQQRVNGKSHNTETAKEGEAVEAKGAPKEKEKEAKEDGERVETIISTPSGTSQAVAQPSHDGSHPLEHTWSLYFDSRTCKPDASLIAAVQEGRPMLNDYEKALVKMGNIDTVESFARHFNNIRLPGALSIGANYHLFKKGIVPLWEDPANANGGKWTLLFRAAPSLMDLAWSHLTMGLVGGLLDPNDEVTGVVASNRPKISRIQLWTRRKGKTDADAESLDALGKRIYESLDFSGRDLDHFSMEFQCDSGQDKSGERQFFKVPFPNERQSFSNAPLTPSRLGTSHLPARPDASPRDPPHSPNPGSNGRLAPPGGAEPMRRIGSGQGMGAFSGPMVGMSARGSQQGRLGVAGGQG